MPIYLWKIDQVTPFLRKKVGGIASIIINLPSKFIDPHPIDSVDIHDQVLDLAHNRTPTPVQQMRRRVKYFLSTLKFIVSK